MFFPPRFVRSSATSGRPDWVPWPATPGLGRLHGRVITAPGGLPPRRRSSILHVTVVSANTAVPHGSGSPEGLPKRSRGQLLLYGESQNPCEAPAGTECNPGGYYHIIWRTCGGICARSRPGCQAWWLLGAVVGRVEESHSVSEVSKHPP